MGYRFIKCKGVQTLKSSKAKSSSCFIIYNCHTDCGRNIFYKRHGRNQESAKFVRRHSLNVCKTYGYFSYLCRIGKYFADDMLENGKRLALSRFRNLAHSIRIGIGVQTFTHAVYAFAIYRSSVGNVALSYPWVCQNL